MNPWIIMALVGAVIVFAIDFVVRRKKWKDNTKAEKISLVLHMCVVGVYLFLAVIGMFLGIVAGGADTAFGQLVNEVTLVMAAVYGIVAFVATIAAFVLRKLEKTKASILIHVFALAYFVIVLIVNDLSGKFL